MTRRSTALRVAAVSAALLALVGVVALASGRDRPAAGGDVTNADGFLALKDGVFTVVVTAYVLTVLAVAVFLVRRRRSWQPPETGRWDLKSIATFLLFVFAVMVIVYNAPPGMQERFESWGLARTEQASPEEAGAEAALDGGRGAEFRWPIAAGLVGALGAGAAALLVLRRRMLDDRRPRARSDVAEELAAVVDDAIADVGRETDPRRAVIAAYAQMERAVGERGLPRRAHEAPFEYLARILGELRVRPAAVLALTELFERARFSTHTIDPAMRDEAVGALAAVRDDLRGTAPA